MNLPHHLLVLSLVLCCALSCVREPPSYLRYQTRSSGDNGYKLTIQKTKSYLEQDKYEPGTAYTITLAGARTFNNIQQFTHFMLAVEPEIIKDADSTDLSPQRLGQFMLFPDALAQYKEDCVNTVMEANTLPKSEVKVMWMAPPSGSGCVVFRAMVMEDHVRWWADDGSLSLIMCEQDEAKRIAPGKSECCACDDAKYRMVFEGLWSSETHPKDFPISSTFTHFSDVIGASHDPSFSFWGERQYATDGFRTLAEWGSGGLLLQELRTNGRRLRSIIKAAGLWYPRVNTNTTATFKVDRKHPRVSLASMFGPSPDWVVGINGYDLCQSDCTWKESLTMDLFPYDAGTDSGVTYLSPNAETKPRERMYRITSMYPEDPRSPFYDPSGRPIPPLARLYLVREAVVPRACDEPLQQAVQVEETENTETTVRPECETSPFSEWSPCSATCGKGLRMRTRAYLMPMKAAMMSCDRQLVSKEMCVAKIEDCGANAGLSNSFDDEEDNVEDLSGVCETTEWSSWSECSASCGEATRRRSRDFRNKGVQKKCYHIKRIETEQCPSLPPCLDEQASDPRCPVTQWSAWSPCSVSCGPGGFSVRSRLLLLAEPERSARNCRHVQLAQRKPCKERDSCTVSRDACSLDVEVGPCRGFYARWYYDKEDRKCDRFTYGGCRGNENNFNSREECERICHDA